jgi:PAS domain S-box-containing protein
VEVNLSLARLGSSERVLAFVRDIDARKRAEQRAMALSRFLEGIMDTVDIWVSAADCEGNILVWNQAAERLSGYTRESVLGNNSIWARMYPDEKLRREFMEERQRVLNSGAFCYRHRGVIVTASGETRTVSWNCYRLTDERGDICGGIALAFDITGRAEGGDPDSDLEKYVIEALQKGVV